MPRGPHRSEEGGRCHRRPPPRVLRPDLHGRAAHPGLLRGRRRGRRGAGARDGPRLRRAVPRPVHLPSRRRPPAAGPPRRPDGRHRGPPGVRDHAPGARAGHPSRARLLQRLHEPDPHGGHGGYPARLARDVGAARGGAPLGPCQSLPARNPPRRADGEPRDHCRHAARVRRAHPCAGPHAHRAARRRRLSRRRRRGAGLRGDLLRGLAPRRRDRAAHARRDRRLRGGLREGQPMTPAPGHEQGTLTPAGGRARSAPLMGRAPEPTLFELSVKGRKAASFRTTGLPEWTLEELVPEEFRAAHPVELPEVSERDLVGHFTRLTHRQYSVDLGAYPLGSCTMKYNPKSCDLAASLAGFANVHPAAPPTCTQGWLAVMVDLEESLCHITGMAAATLQPPAGAAGELTGLLLMRAFHAANGEEATRRRVIIPDSAHGTNPASVTLGGFEVTTVGTNERGGVDLEHLKEVLDTDVAGMMLTNPNTLGLFEEEITAVTDAVHDVGGLMYYDGANLNAILGVVRPGDMGFDIVHLNLHKTFATPHGGGGPGAGPVAVAERLAPFLPGPRPSRLAGAGASSRYGWTTPEHSIGRVHSWHGNALVLARALTYILVHGGDGLRRVAQLAVLNANWLRRRLTGSFRVPYDRTCMHEFVLSGTELKRATGVRAVDVAKRLLEEGFHAPTVYFPLTVDEALMVEPTETESLQTLEALAEAFERIAAQAAEPGGAEGAAEAPRTTPVRRVDEARAARRLVPTYD